MRQRCFRYLAIIVWGTLAFAIGCQRVPKGNWQIETGRASVIDESGERRPRLEVLAEAQEDARIKLLNSIEKTPATGTNFVGDYMAQQPRIDQYIRALILSAQRFDTRFTENAVEMDLGVDLDQVNQAVRQANQ